MKSFKRYVVSCLIAVTVFTAMDSHAHPGEGPRYGTILLASAGWPVVAALAVGMTIGDAAHDARQGKSEGKAG